jgi:pimeloyl-ACP methyl ester carboxylesterase
MDARDISAIGEVLAGGLDGTTTTLEEIHQAVARRSFAAAGPVRRLPEAIHDSISARIYSAVRTVGPAAIRVSAVGLASTRDVDAPRVHSGPRGRAAIGALNGIFGDALAKRRNGLALRMTIRQDGQDVPVTAEAIVRAFPHVTARAAVFVHGFGETDDSWRRYAAAHWSDAHLNYGELLRRELGFTPVFIRYNSGRPIEHNARELSELLDELGRNWPGGIGELIIIGHSYGAVVAHAAVHHAYALDSRWLAPLDHVFTLGTARGAEWAERAAARAGRVLSRLPETEPIARMLDSRSAGLKDVATRGLGHLPGGIADVRLPADGVQVSHFRLPNHPVVYAQIKTRLNAHTVPARAPVARGARFERAAKALRSRKRSRRR